MDRYVGLVLWHRDHGYCKVLDIDLRTRTIVVLFCGSERQATYAVTTISRDLQHKPLPLESFASIDGRGTCQLIKVPPPGATQDFFHYVVRFEHTGDMAEADERELSPLEAHPKETLLSRMGACDSHALYKVVARYQFLRALEELHKETGGLEALIGSRVELFPHQAYVAGTIINDSVRRFILADEVGLGKTVEAGLIVNDVLSVRPEARILILAPGALSRQWLCELHMSFGNQGFKLADLYKRPPIASWNKVICSIQRAVFTNRQEFDAASQWDLVIVDEAHHLLWNPDAYQLVEQLSRTSNGLLLLSAVPAREREDELLRLLRLLDPDRYSMDKQIARRFAELYRAQPLLGRGLRILDRDIADIEKGEASVEDLAFPLKTIASVPVLSEDTELQERCRGAIRLKPDQALVEVRHVRDLIVDRYRLSRRIIKNRRSKLISGEMLQGVSREYKLISYEPDGFEMETRLALENLIERLRESDAAAATKHVFFKIAYSSIADPVCASILADELTAGLERQSRSAKVNLLAASYGASYDEYYDLLAELADAVYRFLDSTSVKRFADATNAWIDSPNTKQRLALLLKSLPEILAKSPKVIIFAGAYGSAASLAADLRERLGEAIVEVFTYDLEDAEKEQNVLRFRTRKGCRILVSDETGGEGRNFQFADAIIHYDLPWSVAAIEQRVGRLDRIGRSSSVLSYVLYPAASIEEAFVSCLVSGFQIFTSSISGLEFMLKDAEAAMIESGLSLDWEQLASMASQIAKDADAERITDDAEALTDAGSFPGLSKMRFLHDISNALELKLEDCFVSYFRSLAKPSSAYQYADDRQPNLKLWCLKPDEITKEPLPGIDKSADGLFAERRGTFHRLIARERRDVEFFSVGNRLFDAVASVALDRLSGRVFAIGVRDEGVEAGAYLVIGMRCVIASNTISESIPLQRRIRRHLFGKRLDLIYRLGESVILSGSHVDSLLAQALSAERPTSDLTKRGFHQLVESAVPDWTDYLLRIQSIAFDDAQKVYHDKFGVEHEALLQELQGERLQLVRSPSGLGRDVEALQGLERAFAHWQPVVDVIGVLHVVA